MADDLLDYTVDSVKLGKLVGADLREGKLTLPVIAALAAAPAADRRRMQAIILDPDFSLEDFEILKTDLNHYGGLAYTRQCAASHVARAKAALDAFAPSPTIDILMDIADYTLSRKA